MLKRESQDFRGEEERVPNFVLRDRCLKTFSL